MVLIRIILLLIQFTVVRDFLEVQLIANNKSLLLICVLVLALFELLSLYPSPCWCTTSIKKSYLIVYLLLTPRSQENSHKLSLRGYNVPNIVLMTQVLTFSPPCTLGIFYIIFIVDEIHSE